MPWLGKLFDFSRMPKYLPFARNDAAGTFRGSRYVLDIICVVLIIAIAVLFAGRTGVDLDLHSSRSDKAILDVQPPETKMEETGIVRKNVQAKELMGRNIFSPSGIYAESASQSLPENPYTLIGVLMGKEKKAVFRDYTGAVITLAAGKKLIDGFTITQIDSVSVKLERGKEKKSLRAFDVPNREKTILRKP